MEHKGNARGIALMVLSMASFAVTDTLIKITASVISPAQVMFLLITGSLVVFTGIALLQRQNLLDPRALEPVMLVRYLSEVVATIGMMLALKYVPLSTVGAIIQATPLLVVLGAVFVLGEKVSWRRWSAICVGFVGVLLIVQPGSDHDASVLWAVMAMVGLSVRDLTTRLTPEGMASASLAAYSMIAAIPVSIAWVLLNGESFLPAGVSWLMVGAMVTIGSLGYVLLIMSIRVADISAVTPYRYTRLLFLLTIGVALFDERPDRGVLIGATLIVLSGLYAMWRERVVGRPG